MKAQKQVPDITTNEIVDKIYVVRGVKVMLDKDLAEMYGVETRVLNQAVQRNLSRFPYDFMFQLTEDEFKNLISQFVISSWGGTRKMPYAFTEHGVAMLSSVLRSEQAIQVNIRIVRVYTRMRQLILDNKELWLKIEKIEQSLAKKDEEVQAIFKVLKSLLVKEEKPREPIGFKISGKK
ncbi:ORF6N domain-containing protein [Agriterribacter humi]|jgi:hypothetical protein|uniref:ORF6N domain-containing protein n=1 Tax=Agriterribacter humi TaxID=1104781 RepID=UPI001264F935|nr:ORF6N domain-containing protein [Agriterribacter humi]